MRTVAAGDADGGGAAQTALSLASALGPEPTSVSSSSQDYTNTIDKRSNSNPSLLNV